MMGRSIANSKIHGNLCSLIHLVWPDCSLQQHQAKPHTSVFAVSCLILIVLSSIVLLPPLLPPSGLSLGVSLSPLPPGVEVFLPSECCFVVYDRECVVTIVFGYLLPRRVPPSAK